MFYNTEMLTKRGPLARVWMASHLSTKLSKTNLLATSIPSSVTSILGEALLPMALRLSGQLLLGVARIYSRKAKYLLDDCNETLSKVKRAFRPGQVDMDEVDTAGGAAGGRNGREAINLRAEEGGIEDLLNLDAGMNYWDMDFGVAPPLASTSKGAKKAGASNTMTNAQLTLAEDHFAVGGDNSGFFGSQTWGDEFGMMGGEGGIDLQLFGDDPEMQEMLPGGGNAKGKKRARSNGSYEEDDPEADDEDRQVEVGRDAAGSVGHASARKSSAFGGAEFDLPNGAAGNGFDMDGDMTMNSAAGVKAFDLGEGADMGGMGDFDYHEDFFAGQDFGGGGDEEQRQGARESTPQANGNGMLDESFALTPKTAADLARLVKKNTTSSPSSKKQKLGRKQVVDSVTELEWESGRVAKAAQKENLFTEPIFLPRSRLHLRLLEVASHPEENSFLQQRSLSNGNDDDNAWIVSAPLGLAPEIANLFQFQSRRARIEADRRRSPNEDRDVEQGRHRAVSQAVGAGEGGPMDMGGMGDFDYQEDFFAGQDFAGGADETNGSIRGFQFDVEEEGLVGGEASTSSAAAKKLAAATKKRSAAAAEMDDHSQRGSPGRNQHHFNEDYVLSTSSGPLAVFDDASGASGVYASQSQPSQLQHQRSQSASLNGNGTMEESMGETEEEAMMNATQTQGGGYKNEKKLSKNTVKALGVLRDEFSLSSEPIDIVFEKVAEKASRRAAAAFFFELLVLSTRDCVKVQQKEAFGSIVVSAKDKLWSEAEAALGIEA